MEIDGVLILGVAISAADAFSPSANAVVTTRTVATKPVVTDAFSITAKPTSVTNDVNLKQLREAFEVCAPSCLARSPVLFASVTRDAVTTKLEID